MSNANGARLDAPPRHCRHQSRCCSPNHLLVVTSLETWLWKGHHCSGNRWQATGKPMASPWPKWNNDDLWTKNPWPIIRRPRQMQGGARQGIRQEEKVARIHCSSKSKKPPTTTTTGSWFFRSCFSASSRRQQNFSKNDVFVGFHTTG